MVTPITTPPAPGEVPLAVWSCGQPDPAPTTGNLDTATDCPPLTPALAHRLLIAYTNPGDLVIDLADGTLRTVAAQRGRRAIPPATQPAEARLVVTVYPGPEPGPEPGGVTECARTWRHLLAPGGILAAITVPTHHHGRLVDTAALLVAACEQAGLTYLQHIIALLVPIHDSRLTIPPISGPASAPGRPGGTRAHQRVHADVLVFANHQSQAGAHG